jgi:hypothetical protein
VRSGCFLVISGIVTLLGVGGAALWVGSRLTQEPDVVAVQGSPEDGLRAQQKVFELIRGEDSRSRGRPHRVVVTEAELNRFLSKNLVEVAKMPVAVHAVRLVGDGVVEFKGLLPLRDLLSASPLMPLENLVPAAWLKREVWLHLNARASLELGATRSQRRYLRFDVLRFAIGRQPLPATFLRLLPNPPVQALLRWRMPESVEGLTIDPGAVVIKTSS